jgi:acyl transferase domain-containing protein/enoyl-CoA hydratase/carnithine racemase/acyl carrier protein
VLQLMHGERVPSLHAVEPNPNIDFATTPFVVQQRLESWPRPVREGREGLRIGGVSSFGAGGANAHVLLQEYVAAAVEPMALSARHPALLVLSAKTEERLGVVVERLLASLRSGRFGDGDLAAIAYTLQVGREAMEERLGLTAASLAEAVEKLQAYASGGGGGVAGLYRGQARRSREALSGAVTAPSLPTSGPLDSEAGMQALQRWVAGGAVDWATFCTATVARVVSLPTYPFVRERYWFGASDLLGLLRRPPSASIAAETPAVSLIPPPTRRVALAAPGAVKCGPPGLSIRTPTVLTPLPSALTAQVRTAPLSVPAAKDPDLNGLQELLRDTLADVLGVAAETIDPAQRLADIGLDSIYAMEWTRTLAARLGVAIKATSIYEYPTLEQFAAFFARQLPSAHHAELPPRIEAPATRDSAASMSDDHSLAAMRALLTTSLAEVLGVESGAFESDEKFSDIGLDSIFATEWMRLLNRRLGTDIKATRIYDYPTIDALAGFLAARSAATPPTASAVVIPSLPTSQVSVQPQETRIDQILVDTLGQVLGLTSESIGVEEKFVDIGVDSIFATEWIRLVNTQLGTAAKATVIYEYPTIGALAAHLRTLRSRDAAAVEKSMPPSDARLSPPQAHPHSLRQQPLRPVHTGASNAMRIPDPGAPRPAIVLAAPASVAPVSAEPEIIAPRAPEKATPAVRLESLGNGILQIVMEDRINKNACYGETITGLHRCFRAIAEDVTCKVVVLAGYENFFATGGTREGLDAIQAGQMDYNTDHYYRLAIDCQVPVIAAMQGHALGAGWVFGMSCDFPIMALESYYSASFMSFGFTPGVGSTLIFPHKFGALLGQEILFTARRYRGSELAVRMPGCTVTRRDEVLARAHALATELAQAPRESLVELKRTLTQPIHEGLARTVDNEIAMHRRTFVGRTEVKDRIARYFGPDSEPHEIATATPVPVEVPIDAVAELRAVPAAAGYAVVGISGRFPHASDVEIFWKNLIEGRDCIDEVPPSRWDWRRYAAAGQETEAALRYGGLLDDIEGFDAAFFGISAAEAAGIAPQHRLLLTEVWRALEDAAVTPETLGQRTTGVFVAVAPSEPDRTGLASFVPSMLPNRISYALNLRGPSEYCESGCASFPLTLHRAIASMKAGECSQAIVGAVQLLSPIGYLGISQMGLLSQDGCSRSFEDGAAGYVRSECVGAIVLKPLATSLADGDHIYAVIRGTGVCHGGGNGMSLTTPSSPGMKTAVELAYREAGIDPCTVAYIEAHGTASVLGDAIEVNALVQAYAEADRPGKGYGVPSRPRAIGSIKPSIGHAEVASGFAALVKVVMALRHRQLPGVARFHGSSSEIDLGNGGFAIEASNRPWLALTGPDGGPLPRRAALNSYGYTGLNAHVVVEEFEARLSAQAIPAGSAAPEIVVLSARDRAALLRSVRRLAAFIDPLAARSDAGAVGTAQTTLADIAHTLQVGRVVMEYRVALLATDLDALCVQLRRCEGQMETDPGAGIFCGHGRPVATSFAVAAAVEQHDASALASLWAQGHQVDWSRWRHGTSARRVSVPTYPFAGAAAGIEPVSVAVPDDDAQAQTAGSVASGVRAFIVSMLESRLGATLPHPDVRLRDCGIDSHLLTWLRSALEARYGVRAKMRELIECDDIGALAALVAARMPISPDIDPDIDPEIEQGATNGYRDPRVIAMLQSACSEAGEAFDLDALIDQLV